MTNRNVRRSLDNKTDKLDVLAAISLHDNYPIAQIIYDNHALSSEVMHNAITQNVMTMPN